MTPERLSPWSEFTPVPLHGSIFVYMIPAGENFTPVRNLATVSCKHEMTTHFSVKSVCR